MSLFDQVGGEHGTAAIVESFYERMLNDETLKPLFDNVDLSQLKAHQRAFLAVGLGGPERYTGRSMRNAHAGLRIADPAYRASVEHLAAALDEMGVATEVTQQVIERVEMMRSAIVHVR